MLSPRDTGRLIGVHPRLIMILGTIFAEMQEIGHPMFVVEGLRSLERQQTLYAQGRTLPGPIVTDCDGVKAHSNHQAKSDGFGHAVDAAFQGTEPFALSHPWREYGARLKAHGVKWGGSFPKFDGPHAELP